MKALIKIIILITCAILSTSCCTDALWRGHATDNHIIEVSYDDMTERALIEDGFAYTKDDARRFYYVEPSRTEQRLDTAARVAATPVALAADGVIILTCAWAGASPPLSMQEFEKNPLGQP